MEAITQLPSFLGQAEPHSTEGDADVHFDPQGAVDGPTAPFLTLLLAGSLVADRLHS
jgi:hypothetical protein